jgi:hypothetical protein
MADEKDTTKERMPDAERRRVLTALAAVAMTVPAAKVLMAKGSDAKSYGDDGS